MRDPRSIDSATMPGKHTLCIGSIYINMTNVTKKMSMNSTETRRGDQMSRASISRFGRSGSPNLMGSSQTKDFKIDSCHFLVRRSALLGQGKDWLAQCQHNVTTVGYHFIRS